MINDISTDFSERISSCLKMQPAFADHFERMQQACRTLLSSEKYFEILSQHQAEWQHSIVLSFDSSTKISQYISQTIDTSALINHIAEVVRNQNLQLSSELAKSMDLSLFKDTFHTDTFSDSDEVIDRCVATLEKATPYMPEDVSREIQDTVIAPAKRKQLSIDTLLNIIALVLTILIFVFEQATDWMSQQENQKQLDTLCETNQQLSGEIDELGRTIQQLTDEVSELSERLDSSRDSSLNKDNSDGEESEADSLEQIDSTQQS